MSTPEALRKLGWLKLKGALRRQGRKMRTWKGAVFGIVGAALFVLWMVHLGTLFLRKPDPISPEHLPQSVAIGGTLLLLLSLASALNHRGLFLPRDEIERLLSAPVRRSDLVRYRLRAGALRSLLGGLIVGLMVMQRMPQPGFGFLGGLLAMQTLPVLQQLMAILIGGLENRLGRQLARVGRVLWPVLFVLLVLLIVAGVKGVGFDSAPDPSGEDGMSVRALFDSVMDHPYLVAYSRIFLPWANMLGAQTLEAFLLWFSVCGVILLALVEFTARVPVDFRELSLETSANVAARINRVRRGGGVASTKVSARAAGRRVPWLFGKGPAGAIAWRKTGSILRKARGTLFVSVLVVGFVTYLAARLSRPEGQDPPPPTWPSSILIAGLGTLYLCAGLRFDFREDLDRMEVILAWPIGAGRLFFAMLAPQVLLVSALLVPAVTVSAFLAGEIHPITLGVIGCIPLVAFGWAALDNAVFLFAPVRMVAGQDGALQNAGRGMVLMFVRMIVLALLSALGALFFYFAFTLAETVFLSSTTTALLAGFCGLWLVLLLMDLFLIWVGSRLLRGFDVAADR